MHIDKGLITPKGDPIRNIERIAMLSANSGFSEQFIMKVSHNAKVVCKYLDCSIVQSILFSVVLTLNLTSKTVGLDRIAEWLDCAAITLARYINELEELRKRKILRRYQSGDPMEEDPRESITAMSYSINPEVFDALRRGEKFNPQKESIGDPFSLITVIAKLMQHRDEKIITFEEMWQEIRQVLSEHSEMEFLQTLKRFSLTEYERILFFNLADEYLLGKSSSFLSGMVALVTPKVGTRWNSDTQSLADEATLSSEAWLNWRRVSIRMTGTL